MDIYLDNSAFSLLNCDRKFQLRVGQGLVEPKGEGASLGDAVHKCLEYLDKGDTADTMIEKVHKSCSATDIPKALASVTCYKLIKKLPEPIKLLDGTPAVEIKFKYYYTSLTLPGSHELVKVYLVGTIDRIHIDKDILVVLDYKTTAAGTKYAIDKVLRSYAMSFQLPFYLFALLKSGILPAVYLDYLSQRRYRMEVHLLALNTNPLTVEVHRRFAFNDDFIEREVPLIINSKIQQAVNILALQTSAPHTGMTVYKACDDCGFRNACLVLGEPREQEILSHFDKQPYNPLTFR